MPFLWNRKLLRTVVVHQQECQILIFHVLPHFLLILSISR